MVDRVDSFEIVRDYQIGFIDNFIIKCQLTRRMYNEIVWPSRNNIKVRLTATQVTEQQHGKVLIGAIKEYREYKGLILNPVEMTQSTEDASTIFDNGRAGDEKILMDLQVQVIPIFAEELYKMTYGGIFTTEPWRLLRNMLQEAMWMVSKEMPDGVDFIEPDVNSKILEILIPHGTRVIDLPRYIQKNWYGIYRDGIGSYIADRHWFIYPLYRIGRWDKEKHKITMSILPQAFMIKNLRSYHVNVGEVNIICSADTGQFDEVVSNSYNYGDGYTVFDGEKLAQDAVEWGGGIVKVDGRKARKEIVKYPDQGKKNYLPMADQHVVESDIDVKTNISARQGIVIKCTWEHSHPFLLHPGMPVKVVFFKAAVKYTVEGNILSEAVSVSLESGPSIRRHFSTTVFAVHCDPATIKMIDDQVYDVKGVSSSKLDNHARLM